MNTILDTKPYMLYETVGMLVKYVNRISMLEIRDAMLRLYRNYVDETWHRRLECLQDIVQEVCKDVNREATEMQYFFGRREPGPGRDATTMARVMTIPFQAWRDHTLAGEARVLKENWRQIQERGFRLAGGLPGLTFLPLASGEKQEGLFRQVYRMGFSCDFAMEVVSVLEDYDATMDRLTELILPYSQRLEQKLQEYPWLMEGMGEYWASRFLTMKPEAFLEGTKPDWALPETAERQVCFCLMDAAEFHSETGEAILHDGRNLFVFGGALVAECSRRMYGEDLDEVCAAFRALSDKTKLMLLMRLSEGRSYCQQLAEENGSNTGNMSRSLAALTRHGFLKQEQEQFRTYYTTDIDGIGQFFGEVQDLFQRRRNG